VEEEEEINIDPPEREPLDTPKEEGDTNTLFNLRGNWSKSMDELRTLFDNPPEYQWEGAEAHSKEIADLNKQSSDALKKAKDRDSGKSDWTNTKAGKEHMKYLKTL